MVPFVCWMFLYKKDVWIYFIQIWSERLKMMLKSMGLVFECLSCGLLGVFWVLADWWICPFLLLLKGGDWHFGHWVVSRVGWAWGCFFCLFVFVCLFVCLFFCFCFCHSPSAPVTYRTLYWVAAIMLLLLFFVFVFVFVFLLCVLSFGISPHASLGDKDAGIAFSREHGHLGTMGEQCCTLNGHPRLINKNE